MVRILKLVAAATSFAAASALAAGAPALVSDINAGPDQTLAMRGDFAFLGNVAYFIACRRVDACGLWKTDGTAAGTVLVKDPIPGGLTGYGAEPAGLVSAGGLLYFTAGALQTGRELWRSDGTAAGTFLVKDLIPGVAGSNPERLTAANGKLYFTASVDAFTQRLYVSDGTEAGTVQVPGAPEGSGFQSWGEFRAGATRLYFVANGGNPFPFQLWRTDGVSAEQVIAFSSTSITLLSGTVGDEILFATFADPGPRLWRSDGTFFGTEPIAEISVGCNVDRATAVLGTIRYFAASPASGGCNLWRSDGTQAGTAAVTQDGLMPRAVTAIGGALYFWTGPATINDSARLRKSDGTLAGTVVVQDFGLGSSAPELFTAAGDALVFWRSSSLWISDGTPSGTAVVKALSQFPGGLKYGAGRLYFTQSDSASPWTSDLTAMGTVPVKQPWEGSASSAPAGLRDASGTLFLGASDGSGRQLWSTRGDAASTAKVMFFFNPAFPGDFIGTMGEDYYFASGGGLMRARGTTSDVVKWGVSAGITGTNGSHAVLKGNLYFQGTGGDFDRELWKTDGTEAGTVLVKDISPGSVPSYPNGFVTQGDYVYFMSANPQGLWRTDGTEPGTLFLKADVAAFARAGDKVVFVSGTPLANSLWVSDGSGPGTQPIANLPDSVSVAFAETSSATYFFLSLGSASFWKTDGTGAGTAKVMDGVFPVAGFTLGVGANLFFFTAEFSSGSQTYHLWRSDGTAQGTAILRSFPGAPTGAARVGNTYYFSIPDGTNGTELWKSDGTAGGTVLAAEVVAGVGESLVSALTVSGNKLYFVAQDASTGPELYAIAFDGTPDAFSFAAANGAATGATLTSNTVTLNGLEMQVPIRVSGGTYSIGCNGKFTSDAGIAEPGATVCVRHVAANVTDATTTTTLTVGDFTTTFISKTVAGVLTNPRLFAAQQYRDFLGREGESAGLDFYEQLISSGAMTQRQLIEVFLASPEFQNGLPQMIRLYFAFFNRIPDYAGLMFQVDAYRSGAPIDSIALNFSLSPEFTATYGNKTNEEYVDLVYQNVLGRAPDAAGRQYYLDRLNDGRLTRGSMMVGFSESAEFQQILDDEVYVIAVYVGMLRRTPEQAGLTFYVNLIEQGLARNAIIEGFLASPEYRGRF